MSTQPQAALINPNTIPLLVDFADLTDEEAEWWLDRAGNNLTQAKARLQNSRLPATEREEGTTATDDYNAFATFRKSSRYQELVTQLGRSGIDGDRICEVQDKVTEEHGEWWSYDMTRCVAMHAKLVDDQALDKLSGHMSKERKDFVRRFREATQTYTEEAYAFCFDSGFRDVDEAVLLYFERIAPEYAEEADDTTSQATPPVTAPTNGQAEENGAAEPQPAATQVSEEPFRMFMSEEETQARDKWLRIQHDDYLTAAMGRIQQELDRRKREAADHNENAPRQETNEQADAHSTEPIGESIDDVEGLAHLTLREVGTDGDDGEADSEHEESTEVGLGEKEVLPKTGGVPREGGDEN